MKRMLTFLSAAAGIAGGISAATWSAKSPDGLNEISLDTEPALRVTVLRRGQPRAEVRNISLDVAGRGVLGGAGCTASGIRDAQHDAEVRLLRAYYYYELMDLFGQVPVAGSEKTLKAQNVMDRSEAFRVLVDDLSV